MGILDPLFNGFRQIVVSLVEIGETIRDPDPRDEQVTDEIGQAIEDVQPADELGAALVDVIEEFIISDLEDEGELTPGNVENILDGVEGRAVGTTIALGLCGSALEASTLGQVDKH
jgi:hypothetical protein